MVFISSPLCCCVWLRWLYFYMGAYASIDIDEDGQLWGDMLEFNIKGFIEEYYWIM